MSVLDVEHGDVSRKVRTVYPQANALKFFSILSEENKMNGTYTTCRP